MRKVQGATYFWRNDNPVESINLHDEGLPGSFCSVASLSNGNIKFYESQCNNEDGLLCEYGNI